MENFEQSCNCREKINVTCLRKSEYLHIYSFSTCNSGDTVLLDLLDLEHLKKTALP